MFSIKADFEAAERLLSDLGRKQLPFATAMALNETAETVKAAEEQFIKAKFDRPTPFTQRGLYLRRASKGRLTATIGMKKVQSEYLKWQVTGGTRRPKGRALLVPVGARLNKYGNMPKGAVKRLKSNPRVFVASAGERKTAHLAPGIYERPRKGKYRGSEWGGGAGGNKSEGRQRGPRLLVAFEPHAAYRARYPFGPLAAKVAREKFRAAFPYWLKRAIETARK